MAFDSLNIRPPVNWAEFRARFFWGMLFGGIASLGLCLERTPWPPFYWLVIAAGSLLFGLIVGWFGDRFWYTLLRLLGW